LSFAKVIVIKIIS